MSGPDGPHWFAPALAALLDGHDLTGEQMTSLMEGLLAGQCTEAQIAALLVALRIKGETAGELASAAGVMRRHCLAFDTGRDDVLDTCGTGGDGACTFNISTATALVVAAAGVPVVKHGNRAISSSSGSADVLTALGVQVAGDPASALRCLHGAGMAFCLAPRYHPALQQVGLVRRQLGVRTLFNCLGPLANPARTPYQLLGVGRPEWLDRMAGALGQLGIRHALLVHAGDGLDEVSLSATTHVREVTGHEVVQNEWTPADFGLPGCQLDDLRVDSVEASAATIRAILAGKDGPPRWIVLANAAAALLAARVVTQLPAGVAQAAEAIDSGRAASTLDALVRLSH